MSLRVTAVDRLGALPSALADHPVLTLDIGSGFTPPGYALEGPGGAAVAVQRRSDHGIPGLALVGDRGLVSALVRADAVLGLVDGAGLRHISLPRGLFDEVGEVLPFAGGGEWDWMWTQSAPPVLPGEERIVTCVEAEKSELTHFLEVANPRTHGQPFARPDQEWVAIRAQDGSLIACGCAERAVSGHAVLAGIAVDPGRRGEGWGAAVTAHLTRRAVAATGACTLGMFADNTVGRALYHRLGFVTGMEWSTRGLAQE